MAVRNELAASDDFAQQIDPAFARFRTCAEQFVARLPLFFLAVAAFAAIIALGFYLARLRVWDRLAPNAFIAGIYRQAFRVACGIAGVVIALDLIGAVALLGTILGAAGIIGLAIGFAVRDTVENFVASIMLSVRQPFLPNDLVEIEGDRGRVIRLNSRATILLSLDGNRIRIPNATVFKGRIVNYTQNPARLFVFDIGIDPNADLEATRLLAQNALKALPFVLDEPGTLIVAVKTADQQAQAMLFRTREMFLMQPVQLTNALSAHCAEDGVIFAQTRRNSRACLERCWQSLEQLPHLVAQLSRCYLRQIESLEIEIGILDVKIIRRALADAETTRLQTKPGIRPQAALAVQAFCPSAEQSGTGRDFAAWLGLVPRQHSTGGRARLGRITEMGQRDIRRLLILGANAAAWRASKTVVARTRGCEQSLIRNPVAADVALSNRMARRLWAMMRNERDYEIRAAA